MTAEDSTRPNIDLTFSLVDDTELPPGIECDDLEKLTAFVLGSENAVGTWDVTVALVGDVLLQKLHRDFMGLDTPTDILTFPNDVDGVDPTGGELVISVDHARTQASAWGLSPVEEVKFLVVHGLLHLLGWRDEDEVQRQTMLDRQQRLFDEWRGLPDKGPTPTEPG